jgi:hypothetical protein
MCEIEYQDRGRARAHAGRRRVDDGWPGSATIAVAAPLTSAHAAGAQVSGTGILTTALTKAHASGALVAVSVPTPGAPSKYDRARH